jgi:hypothetical protein
MPESPQEEYLQQQSRADGIWELIKVKAQGTGSEAIHTRRSADPVVLSLRSLLKTSS